MNANTLCTSRNYYILASVRGLYVHGGYNTAVQLFLWLPPLIVLGVLVHPSDVSSLRCLIATIAR